MRLPMTVLRWASRLAPDALQFQAAARGKSIALTFDDGPHPENTARILDVLARRDARATFFMQGDQARRWPEIVRRVHAAGHQLAGHGMEHVSALSQPTEAIVENADQCHALLTDIVGADLARDFRPPYGDMTVAGFRGLRRRGYRLVYWSYDSDDSNVTSAAEVLDRLSLAPPVAGSIVLFHDDYAHTTAALEDAIVALKDRGLAFETVGSLCGRA